MMATPASPEFATTIGALSTVACLVIALGAYQAQRRWARNSNILDGQGFREAVDRIQAGRVDAVGFGVLRRAYHQRQTHLPAYLQGLEDRLERGLQVSLYDPEQDRQIESPTLAQFAGWAEKHFPGALR